MLFFSGPPALSRDTKMVTPSFWCVLKFPKLLLSDPQFGALGVLGSVDVMNSINYASDDRARLGLTVFYSQECEAKKLADQWTQRR